MTALRLAVVILLLLVSSAVAGPEGSTSGLVDPSLLMLSPADDLFATADLAAALRTVSEHLARLGYLRKRLGDGHIRPALHREKEP
jgi:hypothetical protein